MMQFLDDTIFSCDIRISAGIMMVERRWFTAAGTDHRTTKIVEIKFSNRLFRLKFSRRCSRKDKNTLFRNIILFSEITQSFHMIVSGIYNICIRFPQSENAGSGVGKKAQHQIQSDQNFLELLQLNLQYQCTSLLETKPTGKNISQDGGTKTYFSFQNRRKKRIFELLRTEISSGINFLKIGSHSKMYIEL